MRCCMKGHHQDKFLCTFKSRWQINILYHLGIRVGAWFWSSGDSCAAVIWLDKSWLFPRSVPQALKMPYFSNKPYPAAGHQLPRPGSNKIVSKEHEARRAGLKRKQNSDQGEAWSYLEQICQAHWCRAFIQKNMHLSFTIYTLSHSVVSLSLVRIKNKNNCSD